MTSYSNRVQETTTTTGTGVISLAGAATGFQAFSAAFLTGNSVHYAIVGRGTGEWETGIGTLTSGTPWTLARTTVESSSNGNALVNFSAGTKEVFSTLLASEISKIQAAVQSGRQVQTAGLASGGGDLSADRTINVPKSNKGQAEAGTDDTTAMTPVRTADAIAALAVVNIQLFDTSGTWTKPSRGTVAFVETWGAGGGGAAVGLTGSSPCAAGGGGGAYNSRWINLADLANTVSVTVGAGGGAVSASGATGNSGGSGGTTSFGGAVTAYGGGGGGANGGGGGGGGALSVGAIGSGSTAALSGSPRVGAAGGSFGDGGYGTSPNAGLEHGGGGGGNVGTAVVAGASSVAGGGGGGAGYRNPSSTSAGGVTYFAGPGGAGLSSATNASASDGVQPGGGGGGAIVSSAGSAGTTVTSGAGGAGRCIVRVF